MPAKRKAKQPSVPKAKKGKPKTKKVTTKSKKVLLTVQPNDDSLPSKRGRGRPKKVVNEPTPQSVPLIVVTTEEPEVEQAKTPPKPRGRKVKAVKEVTTNAIVNVNVNTNEQSGAHSSSMILHASEQSGAHSSSMIPDNDMSSTTGKRGRPKKTNPESCLPPKKRGRPSKVIPVADKDEESVSHSNSHKRTSKRARNHSPSVTSHVTHTPRKGAGSKESSSSSDDDSGDEEWETSDGKKQSKDCKSTKALEKALKACRNKSPPKLAAKRRGRPCKQKETSSEIAFSIKEKTAFLECLNENGFHVIYDTDKLKKALPNRTPTETKFLIDSYSRKGKELAKKKDEESRDKKKNASDTNTNKSTPIELWYEMIHQLMNANAKKDDMSSLLADIFQQYSIECEQSMSNQPTSSTSECVASHSPNYALIYFYLSQVLRGKCPPELKPVEGMVIIKLMEELNDLVMVDDYSAERDFLAQTKWKNSIANSTGPKASDLPQVRDEIEQRETQDMSTRETQDTNMSTGVNASDAVAGTSSGDSHALAIEANGGSPSEADENNELACHLNLPKIRKIGECFNPLQVPIDMLKSELNRWSVSGL